MLYVIIALLLLELVLLCVYGGGWLTECARYDLDCPEKVYDQNSPDVFVPRTNDELWHTREHSYGYPFYWMMQYCPGFSNEHPEVYNRFHKDRSCFRNVMYLE